MKRIVGRLFATLCLGAILPGGAMAADGGKCPRPAAGSDVKRPPDLYSTNGILNVSFDYWTALDAEGRTLFCFVTPDGIESPTLQPGRHDQYRSYQQASADSRRTFGNCGLRVESVRQSRDDADLGQYALPRDKHLAQMSQR